jgi:hypothetical protein
VANSGLPASAPILAYARTWSSYPSPSEGIWNSNPFTPAFGGYLKIEVAGNVGEQGLSVSAIDQKTGEKLSEAKTKREPRNAWHSVYLPVPHRPVQLVATDNNNQDWLAFSEPVEMSTLSFLAMLLVKQGALIFFCAATAALLLSGFDLILFVQGCFDKPVEDRSTK